MCSDKFKINTVIIVAWMFPFILQSCVDEYWPDLGAKYEQLLVVDGMITNQPGPYTIRLSLSSSVNHPEFKPLSGYHVIISDDLNNEEVLNEIENGVYQTSPDGIQGVVGCSYKITIMSPDNNRYESEYQLLREPTEIDRVYYELESNTVAGYDHNLVGYQFYIDTKKAESDTNYFLWRIEDTYKYNANHRAKYIFDDFTMDFLIPSDSIYTCWKTRKRKEIITAKTENLTEPVLLNMPMQFVTTETKELSVRYSLLVKQYTISQEACDFWSSLEELEENADWLYTMQPYQIQSNINCISNADEPVLGYFLVAGIDQKRIFVDRPVGVDWYYNATCNLITEDLWQLLLSMHASWPLYLTAVYSEYGQSPALPTRQYCVDCRKSGGELIPPEFWIE